MGAYERAPAPPIVLTRGTRIAIIGSNHMKRAGLTFLTLVALFLLCGAAQAEFLYFPDQVSHNFQKSNAHFAKVRSYLVPNEHQPAHALPALNESPRGVYIAVGTERGFIGAAFSKATHLLLADVHPEVVEFNRLNILLLKACHGDSRLFTKARLDPEAWNMLADSFTLPENEKATLIAGLKSAKWQEWVTQFEQNPFWRITPQEYRANYHGQFYDSHYVLDEVAFKKLTAMALEGKIQAENIDLSSAYQVAEMVKSLEAANLSLSTLDLSNAWQNGFIGAVRTQALIQAIKRVSRPDSMVLLTNFDFSEESRWLYQANTIRNLKRNGYFSRKFVDYAEDLEFMFDYFHTTHSGFKQLLCGDYVL